MKNNIELVNSTGDGSCDRLGFTPPPFVNNYSNI